MIILGLIVLLAFVTRLAFVLRAGTDGAGLVFIDSPSYTGPAEALLENGRFWTAPGSGEPIWVRPLATRSSSPD